MEHDGENLRKAVAAAGITVKHFADLMRVGRNTPSRWYASDSLPIDKLVEASTLLAHDPAVLFPRLQAVLPEVSTEAEPTESIPQMALVMAERDEWQRKAYQAVEKYSRLLEMHAKLLKSQLQSPKQRQPPGSLNSRFATCGQ